MKIVKRSGPRDRLRLLRRSHQSSTSDRLGTTENSIRKEIAIMKVCRHVHLVELFEVIDDPTKDRICIGMAPCNILSHSKLISTSVMEHLSGGQVQWADENDKPLLFLDQTRRIIRDVIVGLEYRRGLPLTSDIAPIDRLVSTVHFHGIIHRDIKPANLMWSSDRSTIKIIDFGVSHFSPSERMAPAPNRNGLHHQFKALYDPLQFPASDLLKRIGTPAFLAPEVVWFFDPDKEASGTSSDTLTSLTNENVIPDQRPPVTKAIDIWSLAVTFYCLLFGHTPFSVPPSANCNAHHSEFVLYNLICTHDWDVGETMGAEQVPTGGRRPKDPGHDGYIVIHLLDQMLQKDPRRRPSLEKIKVRPQYLP